MAQVSFWGSFHGQVATTSNVIAAATIMALGYDIRTLVGHTQWSRSTMEKVYQHTSENQDGSMIDFSDSGLDALERLAKGRRLTPDLIKDYTKPILKNRLDFLAGTKKPNLEMFEQTSENIQYIFELSKKYYEVTLLDVHSGLNSRLTRTVLSHSELIVVCLNQNTQVLERFFSKMDWPDVLDEKEFIVVLGSYDPKSKYKAYNIQKKYAKQLKSNLSIYTVPYCTAFRDACNDQNAVEFLIRNYHVEKDHENYFFMQEVKKLSHDILEKIGINTKLKKV